MTYCKECGTQIVGETKFCTKCGTPIAEKHIETPPLNPPEEITKAPQENKVESFSETIQPEKPNKEKAKLGISLGILGAALYFMGILSIFPLVVLAGYVLLFEENAWLKKTAVKAVVVVIFFAILSAFITLAANSQTVLADLFSLMGVTVNLAWLTRILSICRAVISFVQTLILLMLGFGALKQGKGEIKFALVNNVISKYAEEE